MHFDGFLYSFTWPSNAIEAAMPRLPLMGDRSPATRRYRERRATGASRVGQRKMFCFETMALQRCLQE